MCITSARPVPPAISTRRPRTASARSPSAMMLALAIHCTADGLASGGWPRGRTPHTRPAAGRWISPSSGRVRAQGAGGPGAGRAAAGRGLQPRTHRDAGRGGGINHPPGRRGGLGVPAPYLRLLAGRQWSRTSAAGSCSWPCTRFWAKSSNTIRRSCSPVSSLALARSRHWPFRSASLDNSLN